MASGGFKDPLIGCIHGDTEEWFYDWLTAKQLPRFNGRGVLRVVREVGLRAWLAGFSPSMLQPARDRAMVLRDRMRMEGVKALVLGREGYPHLLAQVPDAPWVLFVKGDESSLSARRPVSIVGTRKASSVGLGGVASLFDGMDGVQWTMVSGMADGVDASAHRHALDRGVPTVACLAHGLHAIHPRTNVRLAHRILEEGGCWVSEYLWGQPPSKYTFPARNRIIAGLVQAVVVVESGDPGGSLITARLAQDYDRRVFALSPAWCSVAMKGNARLIREQVAELLHAPEDLPEAMGWREARLDAAGIERAFDSEASERLFEALNPYRAEAFDTLVERLEEEAHSLRKRLLEAELEGWVRCWPGDRFTRTIR